MKHENRFNPSRLTLARKRRGLKKQELAEKIQVTRRAVSSYETGEYDPEKEILQSIAKTLNFPEEFFYAGSFDKLEAHIVSFRAASKMKASQRDAALAAGNIALMLNKWIELEFELPRPDVPDLGRELSFYQNNPDASQEKKGFNPETVAEELRNHWKLGEIPIKNMIALLESKGIRVFSLAIDAKEVDAFSMWHESTPFIFLNTYKSAERSRFDAAHELGHLILHRHAKSTGKEAEKEANAFASAFLMPRKSILATAPKTPSLPMLLVYKKRWIVSVAAINYRLHSLGLVSDWIYRTLCIQISKAGYRLKEPKEAPRETSQILTKVFNALWREGISIDYVAKKLLINPTEINDLTFGLMPAPKINQPQKQPPELHIV